MSDDQTKHHQMIRDYAGRILNETSQVFSNVSQEIILLTEDKIRLALLHHLSIMEQRRSWIAPLGILLTILIVFPTTAFQHFFGLSAATWQAIFVIACLASAFWLIITLRNAFRSSSIDDVILELKRAQKPILARAVSSAASINGDIEPVFFEVRGDKVFQNPRPETIQIQLMSLDGEGDSFALISKGDQYVQTAGGPEAGFILEYQDGSITNHWRASIETLSGNEIINVFQQFAENDDSWRNDYEWEKLEL